MEKKSNGLLKFFAFIGVLAVIAGIAYAVYKYFTPDYLEDADDDDDFDDDFDDFFEDEEIAAHDQSEEEDEEPEEEEEAEYGTEKRRDLRDCDRKDQFSE